MSRKKLRSKKARAFPTLREKPRKRKRIIGAGGARRLARLQRGGCSCRRTQSPSACRLRRLCNWLRRFVVQVACLRTLGARSCWTVCIPILDSAIALMEVAMETGSRHGNAVASMHPAYRDVSDRKHGGDVADRAGTNLALNDYTRTL